MPQELEIVEQLQARLPNLPGLKYDFEKTKLPSFRKSHAFDISNGVNVYKIQAPGIGGKTIHGQQDNTTKTSIDAYPHDANAECVPSWVAFDRKVLRFYAYFQEAVHERREEHYRIRRVNIYFYLEDDTIHVSEPKIQNSGIPQGTLLRRHRIPKSEVSNQHFLVTDLNVGQEVTFYGRTYKVVDCDGFSRAFLTGLGVQVPNGSQFPDDPYTLSRQELLSRMKARRPYHPQTALKQFLENDRKVLRFYGAWDDTHNKYGEVHQLVIHYYLSDDTIEVREIVRNANKPAEAHGIEHTVCFLKRGKIPKKLLVCRQGMGGAPPDQAYFTDSDLIIGTVLHFFNRPFLIWDCDDFTKQYYTYKYGIESFDPVSFVDPSQQRLAIKKEEEQTIETRLVANIGQSIQAPKPGFKNAMKYDNVVLRFSAKMRSNDSYDQERKFVISFYMGDYSLSVFEQNKNSSASGGLGGKYLEKGRVRKYPSLEFHEPRDFAVGASILLYGRIFDIIDADDFALNFMKENPEIFAKKKNN